MKDAESRQRMQWTNQATTSCLKFTFVLCCAAAKDILFSRHIRKCSFYLSIYQCTNVLCSADAAAATAMPPCQLYCPANVIRTIAIRLLSVKYKTVRDETFD